VDAERFDDMSREIALSGSWRGALANLVAVLTGGGTASLFGCASEPKETSGKPCDPEAVTACLVAASQRAETESRACFSMCEALPVPSERARACRACLDSMVRTVEEHVGLCHAQACGSGSLCHRVPDPRLGPGYCCPFEHLPHPNARSSSALTCVSGCPDFVSGKQMVCPPRFKLNTRYCECECDMTLIKCPNGMSLNPVECQCA
jgi:hypothetical protein